MFSLASIPGIGPKTIDKLHHLKIDTTQDLVYHFPSRYLDFSHVSPINSIEENSAVTISGVLKKIQNIYTRNHKNIQIATISDSTGQINLIWFNQPYLIKNFTIGQTYAFAGTVSTYQNKKTIIGAISGQHNTGKIIAIYPETSGLTSNWFRKIISQNLNQILNDFPENLPETIINKHHLSPLQSALGQIHEPDNATSLDKARLRLSLDEMLSIQINSYLRKKIWQEKTPLAILRPHHNIDKLIDSLPFKLTSGQISSWKEIYQDLTSNTPMNRLLQGDVGSGKTVLAILSCYLASLNKTTSVVIAPTEILAKQHYETFKKITDVPIHLLTGKNKLVKFSKNSIIIATHAAIYQKKVLQDKIGLLVIDEQHKFGVDQRSFLGDSLHPPHCLTMTATPIPRSISLTILGNLKLSVIQTLPKNRLPVKTFIVPPLKIDHCYQWLRQHLTSTHQQAFIVCPFIEPSETLTSVKSATKLYEHLSSTVFPDLKLALIHGKTNQAVRQKILDDFLNQKVDILVTTPIIEVGIDFPNASTIIIESADRFGLAQLHQLRGRVGRGSNQSYCYFFTESTNSKAENRLKMLCQTQNGQEIAEYDLATRGPGEAFSFIQHGFPSLKIANISDANLIALSQKILKDLISDYPQVDLKTYIKEDILNSSINS